MTVEQFNDLEADDARMALVNCCAANAWVDCMLNLRPYRQVSEIFQYAEVFWDKTNKYDWMEAFEGHPQIAEMHMFKNNYAVAGDLPDSEPSIMDDASDEVIEAMIARNEAYKTKFGFIFVAYSTGKSAEEVLGLLNDRLLNDKDKELRLAAEEQRKITRLRLQKLFS